MIWYRQCLRKERQEDVFLKKTTLVIMAAGIGSRYGAGIKQLAAVDQSGHIIMDYSIHDAIAAQRISHAQKLINGTSRSFSKIARELGFSSLSNFSHWMRRQTGTSLHELRANPSNTSNNCAGVASDEGNPSP